MIVFYYSAILGCGVLCGLVGLFSSSLVVLTVLMESMSIIFIVSFFLWSENPTTNNVYKGATMFFVVTAISGLFVFSGWMCDSISLTMFGIVMKLAIYPFCGWVVDVYSVSGYVPIVVLSTVYKIPLFFICFLSDWYAQIGGVVFFLFISTLIYSTINLVCGHTSWIVLIISSSLSSSSLIFLFGCMGGGFSFILYVFLGWVFLFILVYFFVFLRSNNTHHTTNNQQSLLVFLLMPLPWSYSIIYKVWSIFVFSNLYYGWWVFLSWWVYSIVEQMYLYLVIGNSFFGGIGFYVESVSSRLV